MSETKRLWNGQQTGTGLVAELLCECAWPYCNATVPAAAELHRGTSGGFLVAPAHFSGGVVVRAADRFFVVEPASARRIEPARAAEELQQ